MILINIITDTTDVAIHVSDILIQENMLLESFIQERFTVREKNANNEMVSTQKTLVSGKTKALLFNRIEALVKAHFPVNPPILYAIPIVQMDWEQAKQLKDSVAKV